MVLVLLRLSLEKPVRSDDLYDVWGARVYVARSTVASAGASLIIGAKICTMALQLV